MTAHARLSPSSSPRWIQCPGSIELVEQVQDMIVESDSVYAIEGTQAHEVASLAAQLHFGLIDEKTYQRKLKSQLRRIPSDRHDEMIEHAGGYVEALEKVATDLGPGVQVLIEQRVDTGLPGCWGTADAILFGLDAICVVDYKYGRGVVVDAANNSQIRLYALGALHTVSDFIGDMETISTMVYQPRVGNPISTETLEVDELIKWRDTVVRPKVDLINSDEPKYLSPSDEACRWCPALGWCSVRSKQQLARDFGSPDLMSPEETSEALEAVDGILVWAEELKRTALNRIYSLGEDIPGWKVVRSTGRRVISSDEEAISKLVKAGFDKEEVVRTQTRTLSQLDKLAGGKKKLQEILGETLQFKEGKESIVPDDDPRPSINPEAEAAEEFKEK